MDDNNTITTNTMGPDSDSDSGGEVIVICIDPTIRKQEYYDAQFEAIRSYATKKIKSHKRTLVGLLTTTPTPFRYSFVVRPTRNLDELFYSFRYIRRSSSFGLVETITSAIFLLTYDIPKGLQRRMVIFAGGFFSIVTMHAKGPAKPIKEFGVTVDVVNFILDDILDCRKNTLEEFVNAVNIDGKKHIIHVEDKQESQISELLSRMEDNNRNIIMEPGEGEHISNSKSLGDTLDNSKKTLQAYVAGEMKNKDGELIHSKTSRLSKKKTTTYHVKKASKLPNGSKHSRSLRKDKVEVRNGSCLTQGKSGSLLTYVYLIVCLLAALLMCVANFG